jgi:hypothetical protein
VGIIFQNAKWVEEDSWTLFELGPIVFLSEESDCCRRGRREDEVGEAGIELAFPFRGVKDRGEEKLVRGVYFLFGHDFAGNLQTGFVNGRGYFNFKAGILCFKIFLYNLKL